MLHQDRRSSPRVHFAAEAVVELAGEHLTCQVLNLSAGGLLLIPPKRSEPGARLSIQLALPGVEAQLQLDAIIVREAFADGKYGWGVQFQDVDGETQQLLRDYVLRASRDTVKVPKYIPS